MSPRYSTLLVDLDGLFFTWKRPASLSSSTSSQLLFSPTWCQYEAGALSKEDCYNDIARDFDLPLDQVAAAFAASSRMIVSPNEALLSVISALKSSADGEMRVYALCNLSGDDYDHLFTSISHEHWSLFDGVHVSSKLGVRKPSLEFYRRILRETGAVPGRTVFLDESLENVINARSFGMRGLLDISSDDAAKQLKNLFGDAYSRGMSFLQENAGSMHTYTDSDELILDNFSQLLLLEATGDRSLIYLVEPTDNHLWTFFQTIPTGTTKTFPPDLDTTSIGSVVIPPGELAVKAILDNMVSERVNAEGIIQIYFDALRPRFEPVACVNVLTFFYKNGRGSELLGTVEYVHSILASRAYLDGLRYYCSPESFLFFITRLLSNTSDAHLHSRLGGPLLYERVRERLNAPGDALSLAMRVSAANFVGLASEARVGDLEALFSLQSVDGGWDKAFIYKYGMSGVCLGNRGLTTALAMNAIRENEAAVRSEKRGSGSSTWGLPSWIRGIQKKKAQW